MSDQDSFGSLTGKFERRLHLRRLTALSYIRLGESNGGIVLNISEGGLAFTAAEPIAGEVIPRFLFQLGDDPTWIEAGGRISWLDDSKKGAGITFTEIADEDRDRIRCWISSKAGVRESIKAASAPQIGAAQFRSSGNGSRTTQTVTDVPSEFADMFPSERALGSEADTPDSESLQEIGAGTGTETLRSLDEIFPSEDAPRREKTNPAATAAPPVEDFAETTAQTRDAVLEDLLIFGSQVQRERGELAGADSTEARIRESSVPEASVPSVDESVQAKSAPPNPPRADDAGFHHLRVPNFGYQPQPQEDWTKWVDPAAPVQRKWLGLVVGGLGLAALAFAIGITAGRGSLDSLEDSVRALIPDRFQRASNVEPAGEPVPANPAPPGDSGSALASTTPTQSAVASSQSTQPPASQDGAAPKAAKDDAKAEPKPAASSFASMESAGAADDNSATTREDSAPVLVAASGSAARPFRLTVPEVAVSASSSVAVSAEMSVLVPREARPATPQLLKRLQPGVLQFHTEPFVPKGLARNQLEIVRLHANVDPNGHITDVQRLSGSAALAERAMGAVREWKYSPTLLDGEPVRTEEKITMVFRGPR